MASDKPTCDDKKDAIKLDSEESPIGSSVDGDSGEPGEGEGEGEGSGLANPPEQAPKRKGGRKPVCDKTFLSYQYPILGALSAMYACFFGQGGLPGRCTIGWGFERTLAGGDHED